MRPARCGRPWLNALVVTAGLAAAAAPAGLLAPAPLYAQGAGSGATTILRVAPGPVPLSLGNAYSAVRAPMAIEYNPAGLAGPHGLAASYQALPEGVSAGSALLTRARGRVSLGASLRFLDYGEIQEVERDGSLPIGAPTGGTATGGEVSALVGASMAVGRVRLGAAGRWLRQEVAGLSDQALAVDLGVVVAATGALDLGASVQHLGPDVEAGRAAPLPRTVRVGASLRHHVGGVDLLLTAEAREREERRGAGFGIEAGRSWGDAGAALRIGYETRPERDDIFSPLVVGGGVQLGALGAQLAWRSIGPLGTTRQIGLTYRF